MERKAPTIKAGKIELSQSNDEITLRRKNKDGAIITVRIRATQLERWALRQMRDGAFA